MRIGYYDEFGERSGLSYFYCSAESSGMELVHLDELCLKNLPEVMIINLKDEENNALVERCVSNNPQTRFFVFSLNEEFLINSPNVQCKLIENIEDLTKLL